MYKRSVLRNLIIGLVLIIICIIIVGSKRVTNFPSYQAKESTLSPTQTNSEVPELKKIEEKFNPVSIPYLDQKVFVGSDFKVGRVLDDNANYTRYYITYKSGDLTISGIMNKPKTSPPTGGFPLLILNHGYIDTSVYTNGRGLKREQDYLAKRGYVVVHPDYRNHADSDEMPDSESGFRLGYIEDSINAIKSIQAANLPYINKEKVGMLGHSMGGGVTLGSLIVEPDLVDAAVLFAPVSANAQDNFDKYTVNRSELVEEIKKRYGLPDTNPDFWKGISAENFLDKIKAPIMIHHGTKDDSTPIEWSNKLNEKLKQNNKDVVYHVYQGEPHEFTAAWPAVMQRTVEFFDSKLK